MEFELYSKRDKRWIKSAIKSEIKSDGKIVVGLTSGCYDLLHYLHLLYFKRCRRYCDILLVGVDSDDMVRKSKPGRPIVPEAHRLAMVSAINVVDAAFIMGDVKDLETAIKEFDVDKLFKNDFFVDPNIKIVGDGLTEIVIIPDVDMPDSTSGIIESIIRKNKT